MGSNWKVFNVINTHLSAIDFVTYRAQRNIFTAVMDEMARAVAVGCSESGDRRRIFPAHLDDIRCELAFVKITGPAPDLLDMSFLEKAVDMPKELFLCPEMPGQPPTEMAFRTSDVEINPRQVFSFGEFSRFHQARLSHLKDQDITSFIFSAERKLVCHNFCFSSKKTRGFAKRWIQGIQRSMLDMGQPISVVFNLSSDNAMVGLLNLAGDFSPFAGADCVFNLRRLFA
jgi:hypothetical protein